MNINININFTNGAEALAFLETVRGRGMMDGGKVRVSDGSTRERVRVEANALSPSANVTQLAARWLGEKEIVINPSARKPFAKELEVRKQLDAANEIEWGDMETRVSFLNDNGYSIVSEADLRQRNAKALQGAATSGAEEVEESDVL